MSLTNEIRRLSRPCVVRCQGCGAEIVGEPDVLAGDEPDEVYDWLFWSWCPACLREDDDA